MPAFTMTQADEYWEDVQQNPLFQAFCGHVDLGVAEGAQQRWIVCVPQILAVEDMEIHDDVLMDYVIVRTEKDGEDVTQTLSGKTVEVFQDAVETKDGFEEPRRVPVLFEESRYSEDSLPLQILCLQHRFIGGPLNPGSDALYAGRPALRSYVSFLVSFPENDVVLRPLNTSLRDFNNTPDTSFEFIQGAPKKLMNICRSATDALIKANPKFASTQTNQAHLRQLERAVEAYVLGGTYEKVFGTMRTLYHDIDEQCSGVMRRLRQVSQGELGVRREVQALCTGAIRELEELNFYLTPAEKIGCLSRAIDQISDGVASKYDRDGSIVLSMDDLLPLLIHCLVKARVEFLMTNSVYMQHFQVATERTSQSSYHIATLEAAVEYLRTLHNNISAETVGGDIPSPADGTTSSIAPYLAIPLLGLKLLPRKIVARFLRPKRPKRTIPRSSYDDVDPSQFTELKDLGQVETTRAAAAPLPPGKAGEWYAEYYHTVRAHNHNHTNAPKRVSAGNSTGDSAENGLNTSDFIDPIQPQVDHTPTAHDLGFSGWTSQETDAVGRGTAAGHHVTLTKIGRTAQLDAHPLLLADGGDDHDDIEGGDGYYGPLSTYSSHNGMSNEGAAGGTGTGKGTGTGTGTGVATGTEGSARHPATSSRARASMPAPTDRRPSTEQAPGPMGHQGTGTGQPGNVDGSMTLAQRAQGALASLKGWGNRTWQAGIDMINEAQRPVPVDARQREARLQPRFTSGFGQSPKGRRFW